jgi:AAA ATPase domain
MSNNFVGRTNEQQLYKKFLTRETPWVMVITGPIGSGKSRLLRRLSEQPTSNILVVKLDFTAETLRTDPLTLLRDLADQVKDSCSSREFDEFRNALKEGRHKLLNSKSSRITRISQNLRLGDAAKAEGVKLDIAAAEDISWQDIYHQVRGMVTEAFYALMNTFSSNQLVIMLDAYEWLSEPAGLEVGQWVMNELIPGLHRRMRRKNRQCFFVMASRVEPQLDVIDEQDILYLDLPMLDEDAVDEYLEHKGMQGPKLRKRVFNITHGHALSVSIIGIICEEQQEKPLSEDDFPALQEEFNERASLRFVNERILERLDWPYRELTRYGILLRSFNLPLLQVVFHDLRSEQGELLSEQEGLEWFDKLIRYPYIESQGNYRYAFHELLREVQAEKLQRGEAEKERWKFYH